MAFQFRGSPGAKRLAAETNPVVLFFSFPALFGGGGYWLGSLTGYEWVGWALAALCAPIGFLVFVAWIYYLHWLAKSPDNAKDVG